MNEFEKKLLAQYLSENWQDFLGHLVSFGLDEDDAERIVSELEGDE